MQLQPRVRLGEQRGRGSPEALRSSARTSRSRECSQVPAARAGRRSSELEDSRTQPGPAGPPRPWRHQASACSTSGRAGSGPGSFKTSAPGLTAPRPPSSFAPVAEVAALQRPPRRVLSLSPAPPLSANWLARRNRGADWLAAESLVEAVIWGAPGG